MVIYDDVLADGWQSWSWSGSYDLASDDPVHTGGAAIAAEAEAYGAVSLHADESFTAGALRFWVMGSAPPLAVILEADGEGYSSEPLDLTTVAELDAEAWTEVVIDLSWFGDHAWTRVDVFNSSGEATTFHLDDLELLDEVPVEVGYHAVEPVGPARLVLYGTGAIDGLALSCDGVALAVTDSAEAEGPARRYVELDRPLCDGELVVSLGDARWTRRLREADAAIDPDFSHSRPISPYIYGMAFPPDAAYVADHGVTVARWGGNATSLYNPDAGATNLAADWYFENYTASDAEAWMAEMRDGGATAFLSVPALDWVAKDTTGCAYSVRRYGAQQDVDPWRADCGNGVLVDGTIIDWNDPADAAEPWDPARAGAWVGGMAEPPTWIAIDNELDIASETHRDVHPEDVNYDELATRWLAFADAMKGALPDTPVFGPSSCCWWFYWNSAAGSADKDAHGGQDFLPWWLDRVAAHDDATGVRTLDYFDVHYYPNDVFNDADDAATAAERLRATRGLWDPTYEDEGWIGTDEWATQTQPERNVVMLLPRMRTLVEEHYPGTRFALTEWNFGAEWDLSGGLAVADVLGILGREGVDLATYWTAPPAGSPAAAAFRLYRNPEAPFGDTAMDVAFEDPDHLGVYAAIAGAVTTVVVVNKDPVQDLRLVLTGAFGERARVFRFGPETGGVVVEDPAVDPGEGFVVPAYNAVLFEIGVGDDEDTGDTGGDPDSGDDTAADTGGHGGDTDGDDKSGTGCGCATGGTAEAGLFVGLGAALLLGARRRR